MFLLKVQPICFHSNENFLALVAGFREYSLLFHGTFRRMFLLHVQLERFSAVENCFAFFALSSSYSSDHSSLGIVVRLVVFLQIVVAFGSVWTEMTEETGLGHVRVNV